MGKSTMESQLWMIYCVRGLPVIWQFHDVQWVNHRTKSAMGPIAMFDSPEGSHV